MLHPFPFRIKIVFLLTNTWKSAFFLSDIMTPIWNPFKKNRKTNWFPFPPLQPMVNQSNIFSHTHARTSNRIYNIGFEGIVDNRIHTIFVYDKYIFICQYFQHINPNSNNNNSSTQICIPACICTPWWMVVFGRMTWLE